MRLWCFIKNWFFVYLICGGMEGGYYVQDLDAIEQSWVVFLGRRRLIPYVCWGASLTSSLPIATEGLLSQVPTCYASRCHRDSIQLLQAVLPQQLRHGLSPEGNSVSLNLFYTNNMYFNFIIIRHVGLYKREAYFRDIQSRPTVHMMFAWQNIYFICIAMPQWTAG